MSSPQTRDTLVSPPAVLSLRDMSFTFRGSDEWLIHRLTHSFEPGAVTALTGPSGSGKSTLLYILGLMLTPSRGAVEYAGQDLGAVSDGDRSAFRASMLGFVFQDSRTRSD